MYSKEEKEKLILLEERRLKKIYKEIPNDKMSAVAGLIHTAAFARISMQDLENDINENGYTELFSQGNQEPYDRERPASGLYTRMQTNFMKATKQLSDLLPKAEIKAKDATDGFDEFVSGRGEI